MAGTVGQPGERTFYLQASSGRPGDQRRRWRSSRSACWPSASTSCSTRCCGAPAAPASRRRPGRAADDGPLDLPLTEDFRVGAIALAWDGEEERVVIEAQEETEDPVEPLAEDVPGDGPGVLRVRITPAAARAFAQRAMQIVGAGPAAVPAVRAAAGRDGHVCPRQNGHRAAMPERAPT